MKKYILLIGILIIVGFFYSSKDNTSPVDEFVTSPIPESYKGAEAVEISGTVEEVNTGCFADGECYVVIDGRHITTLIGWSREEVGPIYDASGAVVGVGDIPLGGEVVGVVRTDEADVRYTLYGGEDLYLKIISE